MNSNTIYEYTHPGEALPSIALIESHGCLSVLVRGNAPFASLNGPTAAVLLADSAVIEFAKHLNAEMARRHRAQNEIHSQPRIA